MGLKYSCSMLLLLFSTASSSVTFRNNGYGELLVAISPDVPQESGQQVIDGIKSWVTAGSATLHSSTRGWAYIESVLILLPTTWTEFAADTTDKYLFEDAEIRVDLPNPVYGDSPFTFHAGGCGEQGEYTQVTEKFVAEIDGYSTDMFGPSGNVFVHEWSKLRYGVFEEFGYPGDPLYPMFYYKTSWTATGQQNMLTPNFCTDSGVQGSMQDMAGGDCTLLNGVPDSDCVFIADKEQPIVSSVMAIPYVTSNAQYCDDNENSLHHPELPNKQNALCGQRSVWDVVKSHPDFEQFDETPSPNITSTVPSFTIIRPNTASFVFVLDVSGSMEYFDRIVRLRQAVKRWLQYDVPDGVLVGLVTFADNKKITTVEDLTPIDESSRASMVAKVDHLVAKGGTCLDMGLLRGREVLQKGGIQSGGVIVFLTDGMQAFCDGKNERPGWGPEGGIPGVIDRIAGSGIRVVTIAFGPNAENDIETLAEKTNGMAFSVPDGTGPDAINNPLAGSLTFQPSVPMQDMELVVLQQSYENVKQINAFFTLDRFMGGDLKIQVDVGPTATNTVIGTILIDSDVIDLAIDVNGVYQYYDNSSIWAEAGDTMVQLNLTQPIDFLSLKITSKPPADTLPLRTRCWTSAGSETVSVGDGSLLHVLAEVKQGNSPVIGARVMAYIERAGADAPVELELFDAGADPDLVGNDGMYARYFMRFDQDDRYSLKCRVEGTNQTSINQGFIDARTEKGLPSNPSSATPMCCGSNTINKDSKLEPTGTFSRSSIGGSFQVTGVPAGNTDIYPPGIVRDLQLVVRDSETVEMSFTAPGDDLDYGTAYKYEVYYSDNLTAVEDTALISDGCSVIEEDFLLENTTLSPIAAGLTVDVKIDLNMFEEEQQYFLRLYVEDDSGLSSWSNIAAVFIHQDPTSSTTSASQTSGWVLVILCTVAKLF